MLAVISTSSVSEDEQMSSTLSQIAAVVAGVALLTTGLIIFPENYTRSLAKGLTVSVSLAVVAAVLIAVARNLGS
jgi:multisubunit Na+/H+ antiporter MnhG subunit